MEKVKIDSSRDKIICSLYQLLEKDDLDYKTNFILYQDFLIEFKQKHFLYLVKKYENEIKLMNKNDLFYKQTNFKRKIVKLIQFLKQKEEIKVEFEDLVYFYHLLKKYGFDETLKNKGDVLD